MKISRKAGRTGGSRMFIQAGSEIPLEDLLKGMAVVSANDASVAVAEYIGGNVETFVEQMNRKARELGMERSVFKNPNGLPARGQYTTARDMMILARHYLQRFPESLNLHSQQYFTYHDITQRNRNSLLQPLSRCGRPEDRLGRCGGIPYHRDGQAGEHPADRRRHGGEDPGDPGQGSGKLLDEGFVMVGAISRAERRSSGTGGLLLLPVSSKRRYAEKLLHHLVEIVGQVAVPDLDRQFSQFPLIGGGKRNRYSSRC